MPLWDDKRINTNHVNKEAIKDLLSPRPSLRPKSHDLLTFPLISSHRQIREAWPGEVVFFRILQQPSWGKEPFSIISGQLAPNFKFTLRFSLRPFLFCPQHLQNSRLANLRCSSR